MPVWSRLLYHKFRWFRFLLTGCASVGKFYHVGTRPAALRAWDLFPSNADNQHMGRLPQVMHSMYLRGFELSKRDHELRIGGI